MTTESPVLRRARQRMLDLEDIPTCPQDERQVLELLSSDDVDLDVLARAIDCNPGLSANVLSLANSAYYRVGDDVFSTREAIIRVLGLRTVKSLALSLLLSSTFETRRCAPFDLEAHWAHALCTGALARAIAKADCPDLADEAYLCGLLHDFGTLLLVHVYPTEMQEILSAPISDPTLVRARELRTLGLDGGRAGRLLSERWSLPPCVGLVCEFHWDESYQGDGVHLCRLVGGVAAYVQDRLLHGDRASVDALAARTRIARTVLAPVIESFEEGFADVAAVARTIGSD